MRRIQSHASSADEGTIMEEENSSRLGKKISFSSLLSELNGALLKISVSVLAFLMLCSSPAYARLSLQERYEAILSAYQALQAGGRITSQDKEMFERIQDAWKNRNLSSVSALMTDIEERLSVGSAFSDPILLQISQDGSVAKGALDSFPITAEILIEGIDFLEIDPEKVDDMSLYRILCSETYPRFIAPLIAFETSTERLVPPAGWAVMDSVRERWKKVAKIAEANVEVLMPGIDLRRSDADLWLMSAERVRDDVYIKEGVSDLIKPFISTSSSWIFKPEFDTIDGALPRTIWFFSQIRAKKLSLVIPENIQNAKILQSALAGLDSSTTLLTFSHTGLTALHSGNRFIFANRSEESARIDLLPVLPPRVRGNAVQEEWRLDGKAVILNNSGNIENEEVLYRKRMSFILPAKSVSFIEVAFSGDKK